MSFFSSSYRRCRLSCFGTSSYSWRFSSTSGRSFSMSFFVRYRSCFRTCVNSWGLSMSFCISYRCCRSAFSTSCYYRLFSMSFFTSHRSSFCMCFRTSSYSRSAFSMSFFTSYRCSWGLSVSFRTSIYYRSFRMSFFTCYRSCFGTSCYCRGLSVSFFTSCRLCSFGTSSNSRSWRFSMSFFSRASRWNFSMSFFISYRSCRLFSSSVRRSFCMSFFSCTSCYCRSTFSTSSSW